MKFALKRLFDAGGSPTASVTKSCLIDQNNNCLRNVTSDLERLFLSYQYRIPRTLAWVNPRTMTFTGSCVMPVRMKHTYRWYYSVGPLPWTI